MTTNTQRVEQPYGIGPLMQALPVLRAYNALPEAERARAAARFAEYRFLLSQEVEG